MAEPGTNAWLFEFMQDLRREMLDDHKRLRESINTFLARMDAHDREDQAVEDRVLKMEIERTKEKEQRITYATYITIVVAAAINFIIEIIKAAWMHQ